MNKLFIRLILISSIIFTFMINPVSAFRIIFGPVHQTITQDALPFLNPIIVQAIVTGNENRDLADTFSSDSENHFDDCHFFESSQRIRNLYTSIVNGLPVNTSMAASGLLQSHVAKERETK